jgi:hypothetical protein
MAGRKSTRKPSPRQLPFYARLLELGCTYCTECHGYAWPDHTEHTRLVVDTHEPRLAIVGGFGNVRVVDLRGSAAPVSDDYLSDTPMALDSELAEVAEP